MRERKRSRWSEVMSVGDSFGEGGRRAATMVRMVGMMGRWLKSNDDGFVFLVQVQERGELIIRENDTMAGMLQPAILDLSVEKRECAYGDLNAEIFWDCGNFHTAEGEEFVWLSGGCDDVHGNVA